MKKGALIVLVLGIVGVAAYLLWTWLKDKSPKEVLPEAIYERLKRFEEVRAGAIIERAEYGMPIPWEVPIISALGVPIYEPIIREAESKYLVELAEEYPIEPYAIEAYERREPYESIQQQIILKRVMSGY